jgi:TP901 family phage tail tape measure protein
VNDIRRITFIVEATAADVTEAAAQAIDAMRAMARESVSQSRTAAGANDRTVTSNRNVARSYEGTAGAARNAAGSAAAGARTQTAAARDVQNAATRTTIVVRESALQQVQASNTVIAAQRRAAVEASKSAAHIERSFGRTDSALTRFGRNSALALTATTVAVAALGVHFEAETMKLHTQAGVSIRRLEQLRDSVLQMAPQVGAMPDELTEGLYHVVSSMDAVLPKVTRTREELEILREAAKGAAIGGSDLSQTAYVLSSAMNALGRRGNEARRTMSELNAIVGTGDMRMQDMVGAMSTGLIPSAENFGISLHSVGAALAYMVDRGTPAQLAATRLRMSFSLLGAPTQQSAKLLRAIGMSADDVRARTEAMTKALGKAGLRTTTLASDLRKPNGIGVALNDLNRHLLDSGLNANASAALISRAFGGGRSGTAIMELVQHTDVLSEKYKQQTEVVKNWGTAWRGTQQTVQQQLRELEATAIVLGTRMGEWVLPHINDLLESLRDVFDWLGRNQAAAKTLGEVFGGVLAVAMTAWFVSLGRRLGNALREVALLGRGLAAVPGRLESAIAGKSAATSATSRAVTTTSAMPFGGLRGGFGLPGSEANPLFVVPLGAGMLGGVPVAGGGVAGGVARGAETRSAGGVILPPGVRTSVARESEQVAQTFMGSMRGAVGKAVGGVTRGAGIAGMGYLGAELAGQAIGGKTGKTVSSVGSSAAIGAGLGSFIGPEGTAAGAVVGALVGLLHSVGKDYADKIADRATRDLGGVVHDRLQESVSKNLHDFRAIQPETHLRGSRGRGAHIDEDGHISGRQAGQTTDALTPEQIEARRRAARRLGIEMGRALEQGFTRYRFLNLSSMESDFAARMRGMPIRAQEVASKSMIAFARAMERSGRLPKGATTRLIADLEAQYPRLRTYLEEQGADSVRALALTFKNDQVERAASAQVRRAGQTFQQLGDILRQSGGDTRFQWGLAMDFLVAQTRHGTAGARRAAAVELAAMTGLSKRNAAAFAQWMAIGTSRGAVSAAVNLSALTNVFGIALADIAGQSQDIARTFGVKAVHYVAKHPKKVVATGLQVLGTALGASGLAGGGYVGAPGERGHDAVPAILGRGEAVVNHHQQRPVEIGLAVSQALGYQPYSSLRDVFRGESRPHHMARGGFAGGQVFTASTFGGHNDPSAFNHSTASGAIANDSLWGFAELSNPPSSFNFAALGHLAMGTMLGFTYHGKTVHAPKVDVGQGGAGLDGKIRGVDLTYAVGQALGVNGLANIIVTGLHGALAAAGSMLPSVIAPMIAGAGGPLQDSANAALRHSATAANTYLSREMAKMNAAGAAGAMFAGPTPAGVGGFDGLPVAQWIVPELAYARAHGWPGHITSGYRPGFDSHTASGDSEHRGTSYPHGAVDFGGMVDPVGLANRNAFMAATAGYRGPRLIPAQGFKDDGHMSGTGHARGGFIEAAGGLAARDGRSVAGAAAGAVAAAAVRRAAQRVHHKTSHRNRRHKGHRRHRRDPIAQALSPFLLSVEDALAPLKISVQEITDHRDALTNQEGLLSTVAGNNRNFFVLGDDMDTLTPTLQPGEDIHPGMLVVDAQAMQRRYAARTSRDVPLLDLQGDLLDWMGSQASHQLLTGTDTAFLGSTVKAGGIPVAAGQVVAKTQIANLTEQIGTLQSQNVIERSALHTVARAIREREQRRRLVERLAHTAKKRMDAIGEDLRGLNSRSLRERLRAAQDTSASNRRVYDAHQESDHLTDLIAAERSRKHPDHGEIDALEQRKRDIAKFVRSEHGPNSRTVRAAEVAIIRNRLSDEKHDIGEDLHRLTGNTTRIGTSGKLGRIRDEVSALTDGRSDMQESIADILQSQLPTARYERQAILDSLPETDRPILAPTDDSSRPDDSQMVELLRQQLAETRRSLLVSESVGSVLSGFMPLLGGMPKFEHGGRVQNTGMALVHEGEWISPNPRGPYGSQTMGAGGGSAGPDAVHVHLHGDASHLDYRMRAIADQQFERTGAKVISAQIGSRSRRIAAAPGRSR